MMPPKKKTPINQSAYIIQNPMAVSAGNMKLDHGKVRRSETRAGININRLCLPSSRQYVAATPRPAARSRLKLPNVMGQRRNVRDVFLGEARMRLQAADEELVRIIHDRLLARFIAIK